MQRPYYRPYHNLQALEGDGSRATNNLHDRHNSASILLLVYTIISVDSTTCTIHYIYQDCMMRTHNMSKHERYLMLFKCYSKNQKVCEPGTIL